MQKKILNILYNLLMITAGSAITAFAVKGFLVPQEFLARGVTGIALLIHYKTDIIPLGWLFFLVNIPVFLVGWKFVGTRFTLYSLAGMVIYAVILGVMPYEFKLADKMLCAVIAGGLTGIGLATTLRSEGSGGGADILYVLINKFTSIPIGTAALIVNGGILAVMALMFPLENVLYTIIYVAVNMYLTNRIFHGWSYRRAVLIMSSRYKEIADRMSREHIAFTVIEGKGGFKGEVRTILYSVVPKKRTDYLKRSILKTDPGAFIAIMNAEDVTGFEIGNQPHWK